MTQGYRSWLQDLINVWTIPATMLYMFKTFVSLLFGHASYVY